MTHLSTPSPSVSLNIEQAGSFYSFCSQASTYNIWTIRQAVSLLEPSGIEKSSLEPGKALIPFLGGGICIPRAPQTCLLAP